MVTLLPAVIAPRPGLAVRATEPDAALVALWIGRQASPHTRRNYHGRHTPSWIVSASPWRP